MLSQSKKILFVFFYILILFISQELLFRFFFPLPEIRNFNRFDYMPKWMSLHSSQNKYIKNIRLVTKSEPDNITMIQRLNSYGFRGKNWKIRKAAKVKRFLFIGDSFTEGFLVADDTVISVCFERQALKKKQFIEVINFGITGTDLLDYFHLLIDAVPIFKPDFLFLFIYPNDFTQYAAAQAYVSNFIAHRKQSLTPLHYNIYKPRIIELTNMVIRKEMLPFRWPIKKVDFYHPISSPVNPWHNHEPELDKLVTPPIAAAIKNGAFNPFIVGGPAYIKKILATPYDLSLQFSFIQNYLHKFNTKLYVIHIPDRSQVTDYYRQFEASYSRETFDLTADTFQTLRYSLGNECKKLNIPFYDLYGLIKNEEKNGNHLYFQFDEHLQGKAYDLISEAVFNWWYKDSLDR